MDQNKMKAAISKAFVDLESKGEVEFGDLLKEVQKKLPSMTENDLLDFMSRHEIF
jgi:hypothetical protein